MIQQVVRRYTFSAQHRLDSVGPPNNVLHAHRYSVEVLAERDVHPAELVVDTEQLDEVWASIGLADDSWPLHNLNDLYTDTSVEGLSRAWLARFSTKVVEVVEVTVWEDHQRAGRATLR